MCDFPFFPVVKKMRYLISSGQKILQCYVVYPNKGGIWENVPVIEECGSSHNVVPPCNSCGWGWDYARGQVDNR